jgi:hypothetical protein
MAREPRDAVVSLRISDEEQSRLRQAAEARGVSVSALVRAIVIREVSGGPQAVETKTIGSPGQGRADQGIFWDVQDGMTVAGGTLTVCLKDSSRSRE